MDTNHLYTPETVMCQDRAILKDGEFHVLEICEGRHMVMGIIPQVYQKMMDV